MNEATKAWIQEHALELMPILEYLRDNPKDFQLLAAMVGIEGEPRPQREPLSLEDKRRIRMAYKAGER